MSTSSPQPRNETTLTGNNSSMSSGWDLEVGPVLEVVDFDKAMKQYHRSKETLLVQELHPASLDVLLEKVERECADLDGYRDDQPEMDPATLKHVRTDAGTQRALWRDQLDNERTSERVRGRMRRYLGEE